MSLDASRWAWQQRCGKGVIKLVLMSMADRADEAHCCYPSIVRLVRDTELNRKTVQSAIARLVNLGLIRDTGKRKGRTGKVKIYQLIGVPDRHAQPVVMSGKKQREPCLDDNDPVYGTVKKERPAQLASRAFAPSPKGNGTTNGLIRGVGDKADGNKPISGVVKLVKSSPIWNHSINGMSPYIPSNKPIYNPLNRPIYGPQNLSVEPINEPISLQRTHTHTENQKKPETEKIETRENLNPESDALRFEKPQKIKKAKALKSGIEKYRGIELKNLPDGLSTESAKHFIDHRKTIKKPLTQHGFALYLKALLSCAGCGLTLDQIVDETIDAGWQSIKPDWLNNRLKPPTRFSGYGDQVDDNRPRKELRA